MTMTKDQAQMLTSLAIACRPNGARRWDSAGVMAALRQVADRSLAEVVMATIHAASDRDVDSPAVIPTAGSHWSAAKAVKVTKLDTAPPGTRCTVCGKSEYGCTQFREHHGGHEFSRPKPPPDPEEVAAHVAALKAELAPTAGPTQRRTLDDLAAANPKLHARLEELRAANPGLQDQPMREPENESGEPA